MYIFGQFLKRWAKSSVLVTTHNSFTLIYNACVCVCVCVHECVRAYVCVCVCDSHSLVHMHTAVVTYMLHRVTLPVTVLATYISRQLHCYTSSHSLGHMHATSLTALGLCPHDTHYTALGGHCCTPLTGHTHKV